MAVTNSSDGNNSSTAFDVCLRALKAALPYAEDDSFSWDTVVGLVVIKLTNTDSINKARTASHATQIQLTAARDATEEGRITEDFFPTLTLNSTFKQWRLSIPARLNTLNLDQLSGESIERTERWREDSIQIRRRILNDDGQGNGNPTLHICYGDDLMPLRERLNVDDYLVIIKCKDSAVYEAFGVKSDVDLGSGKKMYLSSKASNDSSVFSFGEINGNLDTVNRLSTGENVLLYGVPGSGKSWTIEHHYCQDGVKVERLVFHPDYTNADFIGQILPVVDADKHVTYEFTAGPFTTIIRDAYVHPRTQYVLIIEEINRGNAPAIFGEVFQLLDRLIEAKAVDGVMYPAGTSEYGVTQKNMAEFIYGDERHKVRIPSNLSIIGTMNTSDQNVFTLDTAFQRRWRMQLIENSFENVRSSLAECPILDTEVHWRRFCEVMNKQIVRNKAKMASSEDKRLGVYFVHENDLRHDDADSPVGHDTIRAEYNELVKAEMVNSITDAQRVRLEQIRKALKQNRIFPEKVIKYLWDDAFKFNPGAIFDTEENKDLDSLEAVIRMFVYENRGKDRFKIFKSQIRDLLYES